jgi:hypothetical protein
MSDESSRSARPYGQRRNDGAPSWWAALDRTDLPDHEIIPAAHRRWYEDSGAAAPKLEAARRVDRAPKRRIWLVVLLVALVLAVVLGIAELIDSDAALVAVVTGVPVALATAAAILVAERTG